MADGPAARGSTQAAWSRWARVALCATAVLVGAIGLVFHTEVALGLAMAFGLLTGVVVVVRMDFEGQHGRRRWPGWRWAAAGVAAAPVIAGLIALLGPLTWFVLLVALVVVMLRRVRRPAGSTGPGSTGHPVWRPDPSPTEPVDLAGLTDRELALAWRHSYTRLGRVRNAAQLEQLCALRRRQLDEMERRDPWGFRRWGGSGGWVSGAAAPFLDR